MGNRAILGPRGVDLRPPDSLGLAWNVYLLREDGVKLDAEEVRRTHRVGRLIIASQEAPCARLEDRTGTLLATLRDVRVRRLTKGGGLLLVGVEVRETASGPQLLPQGWWCVLKMDEQV